MNRRHMVDLLFPVALFFVFAVCALLVILFATNVYAGAANESTLNDTSRTSLSYISEKIHRSDSDGQVTLGSFDGQDALILHSTVDGKGYSTYIYYYDGSLMELYAEDGTSVSAAFGSSILKISDFTMEEIADHVFRFTCTDENGETASAVVAARSR